MTFDFRAKLVICLLAFLLAAVLTNDWVVCAALICTVPYLAAQRLAKAGCLYASAGIFLALLRLISGQSNVGIIVPDVFLFAVIRMLAVMSTAHAVISTPPGEVTAALTALRLPQTIALPIAFMLRFLPTVRGEFAAVFAAMRLRGLFSLKRPLRAMEYMLIPLIIRSSRTADALAASAELRGVAFPGRHTSRRSVHFTTADWVACGIALVITGLLICVNEQVSI